MIRKSIIAALAALGLASTAASMASTSGRCRHRHFHSRPSLKLAQTWPPVVPK